MLLLDLEKSVHTPSGARTLQLQLSVARGELLGISGPSGSGKTTLLRLVAGLIRPERGIIRWGEHSWVDRERAVWLAPQRRPVGLVFQDYALFPHMTVLENLRFALPRGGYPPAVDELVELMELGELTGRMPDALSGGQQQRVALARALVRRPEILLLDEPLSALDAPLRARLQQHILQLHKKYGLTTLLVSHDAREIHMLADRVVVLRQGRLHPVAAPAAAEVVLWGEVLAYEATSDSLLVTLQLGDNRLRLTVDMAAAERYPVGTRMPVQAGAVRPL